MTAARHGGLRAVESLDARPGGEIPYSVMAFRSPGSSTPLPRQHTLAAPVELRGTGLHTGLPVAIRMLPAEEDHGIVFRRDGVTIPALVDHIDESLRCSALANRGVQVMTVEHLLAAAVGLGVDNLLVEVDGPEIPAMDGSALPFAEAMLAATLVPQEAPVRRVLLREPVWVSDGDRHVIAVPADSLTVAAAVDYQRPYGAAQAYSFSFGQPPTLASLSVVHTRVGGLAEELLAALRHPARVAVAENAPPPFVCEVAPARTFCFADWIPAIHSAGLGGGGSLENTLVLFDDGPSTPLRFPNELARHKTLDLLGDLALVGGRLCAFVVAIKAGHALHLAAAQLIRRQADAQG